MIECRGNHRPAAAASNRDAQSCSPRYSGRRSQPPTFVRLSGGTRAAVGCVTQHSCSPGRGYHQACDRGGSRLQWLPTTSHTWCRPWAQTAQAAVQGGRLAPDRGGALCPQLPPLLCLLLRCPLLVQILYIHILFRLQTTVYLLTEGVAAPPLRLTSGVAVLMIQRFAMGCSKNPSQ